MKMLTLTEVIQDQLKDKDFTKYYQCETLINQIAKLIVQLRKESHLTQQELAKKAGTTQPVIARLESGSDQRIPSLKLLAKLAMAANATLQLTITLNHKSKKSKSRD